MTNTIKLDSCPTCGAPIPAEAPQGLCPKCVLAGAASAGEAGMPDIATSEIPSLEQVAAAFPQLEVLELVGRGGMGFVFKARQPHLDRFVALKLLPDRLARDPRFAERFNREGRVLARLNHPNIVTVYDFGRTERFYFLIMEFVDGVNLREAMKAGRFSPLEALSIVPKICEALQYAHQQGILHRDIKPANILLDTRGQVKLADFGIAKLVGNAKPDVTLTGTGAALGTPHYMAPEQLERPSEVDHRADIYSLGVVFYEMLTGELPIGRFAPPSSKTPVGTNVDEVVFRTLERDRERRYQSAGEMKTQVEHLTDADTHVSDPVPPKPGVMHSVQVQPRSQKAVWSAVLTGIGLVLASLAALLMFNSGSRVAVFHNPHPAPGFGAEAMTQEVEEDPGIQFTFTAVDLRDEDNARWLTMEYIPQIRGNCERGFPWKTTVPGWTCEVRSTASLVESNAGFAPVRHERIAWKLPPGLDAQSADRFRDDVAQRWLRKQLVVVPGTEETLFHLSLPDGGGTLTGRVAVKVLDDAP